MQHFLSKSRYVVAQPLSKEVQQELHKIYPQHACFRNRQRAHAILLSQRGYSLNQIQDILQADRDSISVWIDRFNADGIAGLDDLPRSGRPLIYTSEDIAFFKAELDKEPRQIKQAQAKLQQQTAKTSSKDTLKRALKKC
jgi:transposase